MTDTRIPLFILFTMNCEPPGDRREMTAPRTWTQSGRSIEGFCTRLSRAGLIPTLFTSIGVIDEQEPMLSEATQCGAEVGLYLHPPQLGDGRFKRMLGQYSTDEQRSLLEYAVQRFRDTLGFRPLSFRGGQFSANDATYRLLFEFGFRQGSLSEPGRNLPNHEARWADALLDPHYVDPDEKTRAGSMPFLELPVSTDPNSIVARGVPSSLHIDAGPFEQLHQPTLEAHLGRMEREATPFRVLCFYTSNQADYYADDDKHTQTLEAMIDRCYALADQYELVPCTPASAHEQYRIRMRGDTG